MIALVLLGAGFFFLGLALVTFGITADELTPISRRSPAARRVVLLGAALVGLGSILLAGAAAISGIWWLGAFS